MKKEKRSLIKGQSMLGGIIIPDLSKFSCIENYNILSLDLSPENGLSIEEERLFKKITAASFDFKRAPAQKHEVSQPPIKSIKNYIAEKGLLALHSQFKFPALKTDTVQEKWGESLKHTPLAGYFNKRK